MNVVSFETAKRLKGAGFPQPEKWTYGSCYYFKSGHLFCWTGEPQYDHVVFAPSATDILKELGRTWNLYYDKYPTPTPCNWVCICDGVNMPQNPQYNTNPAEACAAAWLSIYEKTTNQ